MSQRACHCCDKGKLAFQIPWIRNVYKSLDYNLQGEYLLLTKKLETGGIEIF